MERADPQVLAKHWRWEKDREGLVWLTFDKQGESANTFNREAMRELSQTLEQIAAAKPRGVIICSAKDGFVAGADVEEFTKFKTPDDMMSLVKLGWDVFEELSELPFPTTAMVNGFCMGGGVELALACRYRVALDDKARFALPEVMLGIMPAWHGVQWLPKLVGPAAAFDMLLTGKTVDAKRAKRMGLVDQAVPARILENTARMVTLEAKPRPQLSLINRLMAGPLKGLVVSQARKQVAKKARREHYPSPYAILELWRKYDGNPFLASGDPSASVESLFAHPTTANLIRIFFLQERMKSLGKGSDFKARHVHIVGAGVM
ncbi:MAG TPA: enoyl-CoA hydratase-related protein, partial [Burkholderiales bacterium]|nr:enoyl-CoA hydratase-related protein [Burkholderiales bacterium]